MGKELSREEKLAAGNWLLVDFRWEKVDSIRTSRRIKVNYLQVFKLAARS